MTSESIYCTYVTTYFGNKLPPFYIGSTSVKKIESGYRGSVCSKRWKSIFREELKRNPELFKTEIIEKFSDRKEALASELSLQKSNNVVKSKWFFNESFACVNGFFGTDMTGVKREFISQPKKIGKFIGKDISTGQIIGLIDKSDHRVTNGDVVFALKNKPSNKKQAKLLTGEYVGYVDISDPRWCSGEITSILTGRCNAISKSGESLGSISKDDPRWLTGEILPNTPKRSGTDNHSAKVISIDGIVYPTIKTACEMLNKNRREIAKMIKSGSAIYI